jgi:pheromone shutdown-related protein TraB
MPIETATIHDKEVILVGTAHVSQTSVDEVRQAIAQQKPDIVAVELCQARYDVLSNPSKWQETDIVKVVREKKASLLFVNLLMSSFQRRLGAKLGIRPGEEMHAAIEAAQADGIPLALIDRSIQVTLQRAWQGLSLIERLRLLFSSLLSIFAAEDLSEEDVEQLKQQDMLTAALDEIAKKTPVIKRVVLDERDVYMAKKISDLEGKKVLAVVGMGHVPGILSHLGKDADLAALDYVPPKKKSLWGWLFPAIIILFIALGFSMGGTHQGYAMAKWWIICNAAFGALGAIIALSHPITVLVAALVSPLTTLHPALASGWFAGLSEAYLKKPKVKDFENIATDIMSVRGFWHNSITRILMVVVLTNLGSTAGALLAVPILAKIMVAG